MWETKKSKESQTTHSSTIEISPLQVKKKKLESQSNFLAINSFLSEMLILMGAFSIMT